MRPLYGYVDQGRDAYIDGVDRKANPYPAVSLRALQWEAGWTLVAAGDPLAMFDDWLDSEGARDELNLDASSLRSDARRLLHSIERRLPVLGEFETAAGPVSAWPLNCYGVSKAIYDSGLLRPFEAELGHAILCYGVYSGPVAENSPFSGKAVCRHGWIEFESGVVIDPTRWVFTGTEPSIAVTDIDNYDLAARRLRAAVFGDRPAPTVGDGEATLPWDVNDDEITEAVNEMFGAASRLAERQISKPQIIWLANLPLDILGDHAKAIYSFIGRAGFPGAIPIDNRHYVEALDAPEMAPAM